jgi:hypothetical protein
MPKRKNEPIDFGHLMYSNLIKRGQGRYELTPKGRIFFDQNPAHQSAITEVLRAQNQQWAADRVKLEEILSRGRKNEKSHVKGSFHLKPPAKPKKRPRAI